MNLKQYIGWAFMLGALAAAIGAMVSVDWISNCSDLGGGVTDCQYFGLRKYKHTHDDNGNSESDSGDLSSNEELKRYFDAGTKVLEAGIPALFCMALGPVLYCLYASGKVKSTGMLVAGLTVSMASVVLVVLAMLLYAHEFFVSYCFTMYFVGALLFLTATTAVVVAIFSDQINKPKVVFGIVSLCIGVALVCAALALVNWFHMSNSDVGVPSNADNNYATFDVYIGIKNYKIEAHANGFDFETSGSLKDLKSQLDNSNMTGGVPPVLDDLLQGLIDAGNLALGFGIVGLFFAFLGLLFSVAMVAGMEGRIIGAAVTSNVLAALFVLIGTMTWAHKIHVGYSFIVWTLSGFLVLVGVAFFVAGVSVAGPDGKVALASTDGSSDTGHTLMRDTA